MSEWVKVTASDGHELSVYVARPAGEPKGAVVVVQEIFGVNPSIQRVVDFYASQGYLSVAPAIFDRFEKDLQLGYDEAGMTKAFSLYPKLDPAVTLLDVAAAFAYASADGLKTAVLGFCYGGLMSWISACRLADVGLKPAAAVGYYPGGVGNVAAEEPSCPVMLHFGTEDDHIGKEQSDAVRVNHPEVEVFFYEGVGHAFANADRSSYDASAAELAEERSVGFLKTHLG